MKWSFINTAKNISQQFFLKVSTTDLHCYKAASSMEKFAVYSDNQRKHESSL